MTKENFWEILAIEPTRDLDTIQNAYRKKLITVNPEDDQEGFMLLRKAYEDAQHFLLEEGEHTEETNDYTEWILEVDKVYQSMKLRPYSSNWELLLKNPLCTNFDTENIAREYLLNYLMDNFRLPHAIWVLLDQQFNIVVDQESLKDIFPENFINYMVHNIQTSNGIDFTLFEGNETAPYDQFISLTLSLGDALERNQLENAKALLEEITALSINHPMFTIELANYYYKTENFEKAASFLPTLLSYSKSVNALYVAACITHKLGDFTSLKSIADDILRLDETHYSALYFKIECLLKAENYQDAFETIDFLYDYFYYSEGLDSFQAEAAKGLLVTAEQRAKEEPENWEIQFKLIRLYNILEQSSDALALLERLQVPSTHHFIYYSSFAKTYLYQNDYEKALPYIEKLSACLEQLPVSDDAFIAKRLSKLFQEIRLIGDFYLSYSATKEDPDFVKEYLLKAISFYLQVPKEKLNRNHLLVLKDKIAYAYFTAEDYEKCMDTCTEIIEIDSNYFPAYAKRLEAAYKLEFAKQVLDDYQNCINLVPGYKTAYSLAAQTYCEYEMFDNVLEIYDLAKEREVQSNRLEFARLRALWAKSNENDANEKKSILTLFEALAASIIENDDNDIDDMAYFYFYISFVCKYVESYETALTYIEKAIQKAPQTIRYPLFKGEILTAKEDFNTAKNYYKELSSLYPKEPAVAVAFAEYFLSLPNKKSLFFHKFDNALEKLKLANEMDSNYLRTAYVAYDLFFEVLRFHEYKYEKVPSAFTEFAITCLQNAVEDNEDAVLLYKLGNVHHQVDHFDEAIDYYKLSIEADSAYVMPYDRLAAIYHHEKGYYRLSANTLQKALENCSLEEDNLSIIYSLLAKVYSKLRDFKNSLHYFDLYFEIKGLEEQKLSWTDNSMYDLYLKTFFDAGNYDETLVEYEQLLAQNQNDSDKLITSLFNIAMTQVTKHDFKTAILSFQHFYKKMRKLKYQRDFYYITCMEAFSYMEKNYKKALFLSEEFRKSYYFNTTEKLEYYLSFTVTSMYCYKILGKKMQVSSLLREVARLGKTPLDIIQKSTTSSPKIAILLAKIYYFSGIKKAEFQFCVEWLKHVRMCQCGCIHSICSEKFIIFSLSYLEQGDLKNALKMLHIALKHDPSDIFCRTLLEQYNTTGEIVI